MNIQLDSTAQTVISTLWEKCKTLEFQFNKTHTAMLQYAQQFIENEADRPNYSLELDMKTGEFFLKRIENASLAGSTTKDSGITVVKDLD